MLIIILILLHLCSFLLGHLYLLFHLIAPSKLSLEISQAETTDLIAQHLADFSLLISHTVRGNFLHKHFCKETLEPFATCHAAKKAKAGSHKKLQFSWAKVLLCYYTVLLQEEKPDEFQKPVFILISPHTLKANLPIINMQHLLAQMKPCSLYVPYPTRHFILVCLVSD